MLKFYDCSFSERHEIGDQKTVAGFYEVLFVSGLVFSRCAARVTGKWKGHIFTTPVIAAPAPFFCSCAVSLWAFTVIKKETRIAFKCSQIGLMGENKGCSHKIARPVFVPLYTPGIKISHVPSQLRFRDVPIGGMEITHMVRLRQ